MGEYGANQFNVSSNNLPSIFYLPSRAFSAKNSEKNGENGDNFGCVSDGTLWNSNTLEEFKGDKSVMFDKAASRIWSDICSGDALRDPSLLTRFLLATFADIKKYHFYYWFSFPALIFDPPVTSSPPKSASDSLGPDFLPSLTQKLKDIKCPPFFRVFIQGPDQFQVKRLDEEFEGDEHNNLFGFVDPCSLPGNPGWPLRNYLVLIAKHFQLKKCRILSFREHQKNGNSLEFEVNLSDLPSDRAPKSLGWEKNHKGVLSPRHMNLSSTMDPNKLISSSVDLNLKLMKWRLLPSLELDRVQGTKCLLLGAGTLGCNVARSLMSWGVRTITFVDNGNVSFSNPARQSLFEFEDCINGGKPKAEAAAARMQKIFPGMETSGKILTIPMPGHPISSGEEENVKKTVETLHELVRSHDVIFILTDSRESRWLPTVLAAAEGKLAINSALGFDTFLVLRHGLGYKNPEKYEPELGCYFCNDIVAPQNSLRDRTLDQQCTVTRPGLSSVAAALSVELLVSLLHHPDRGYAPADGPREVSNPTSNQFGIIPHSVRGFLTHYANLIIEGKPYNRCTGCSSSVVAAFQKEGFEFLKKVFNEPKYLEDVAGLTQMKEEAEEVSWEVADEDDF
eukprot:TRINITY_DN2202_c0_g1_i3.p1 TRINITY_DN2202_c0_g1~~TRINITY_DN2202_c0_g1_i3.p1  ORF type:complete len:621 (+),score=233.10 TRINITY_DN2202_c0_g1_i3:151-2013(+)